MKYARRLKRGLVAAEFIDALGLEACGMARSALPQRPLCLEAAVSLDNPGIADPRPMHLDIGTS